MVSSLPQTLIIDVGTAYTKVGYAGEESPRFTFPTIIGTEKYHHAIENSSEVYVGNAALEMRGILSIHHPLQRGVVLDWNNFYSILDYIFFRLFKTVDLTKCSVLYIENLFIQPDVKNFVAQLMFDRYNVHRLMMVPTPILSIFSVGLTTGLLIESGEGITFVAAIVDGRIQQESIRKVDLSGVDVMHYLKNMLLQEGLDNIASYPPEILNEIKERHCYVIPDKDTPPESKVYDLQMHDGTIVKVPQHVLYNPPEILFQPNIISSNTLSITEAVLSSLQGVDRRYWKDLLSRIVFSGGNLSYQGFKKRFEYDLGVCIPQLGVIPGSFDLSKRALGFFIPDNLQFAPFKGASILGSVPSFHKLFVNNEQFQSNHDVLRQEIVDIFQI
ncbi:MAG: actin family protein [Candidatus Lokiarchaeia archaeon]